MDQQAILAQLRPNILPDPVGYWPLAIGWWMLVVCILLGVLIILYFTVRYYRKTRYRRHGIKLAQQIHKNYETHNNKRQYAHDLNRLLKKLALHTFPTQDIASLNGKAWLKFLYTSSGNKQFIHTDAEALGCDRFNPNHEPNTTQLYRLTISWIKQHHA